MRYYFYVLFHVCFLSHFVVNKHQMGHKSNNAPLNKCIRTSDAFFVPSLFMYLVNVVLMLHFVGFGNYVIMK